MLIYEQHCNMKSHNYTLITFPKARANIEEYSADYIKAALNNSIDCIIEQTKTCPCCVIAIIDAHVEYTNASFLEAKRVCDADEGEECNWLESRPPLSAYEMDMIAAMSKVKVGIDESEAVREIWKYDIEEIQLECGTLSECCLFATIAGEIEHRHALLLDANFVCKEGSTWLESKPPCPRERKMFGRKPKGGRKLKKQNSAKLTITTYSSKSNFAEDDSLVFQRKRANNFSNGFSLLSYVVMTQGFHYISVLQLLVGGSYRPLTTNLEVANS